MKKTLVLILILLLVFVTLFTSCEKEVGEGIQIVCVEYFSYDFTREILGDNPGELNVILLNETGQDMHSFEPSIKELSKLEEANLVIYLGGVSESWINDFKNDKTNFLSLINEFLLNKELVGKYDLEEVETVQEIEEEGEEIDEHIYLSPVISSYLCTVICENLCELDPNNSSYYISNLNTYIEKLNGLLDEIKQTKKVLVCDRFPFNYLFQDLGLDFVAAFDGCSTDTNATFDTIIELCKIVEDEDISDLIILEKSTLELTDTIIETTKKDLTIYTLNSLQSINADDIKSGVSYYDVMKENIEILKKVAN